MSCPADLGGPRVGDAFGAALRACWDHGEAAGIAAEIVERDDGFVSAMDVVVYFGAPSDWSPLDRRACDLARGRVDVGPGAGRHAVELVRRGHEVVGIDQSPGWSSCAGPAVSMPAGRASPTSTRATSAGFDTILMFGNNLGLLAGPAAAPEVLARLACVAAPGARILGIGTDPYGTQDPEHLAYHEANRSRGRAGGQLRLRVRYRSLVTDWFDYWFATVPELTAALDASAWRIEDVHTTEGSPQYLALLALV
jgi:hypothetical protein